MTEENRSSSNIKAPKGLFSALAQTIGDKLASFLTKPRAGYETFSALNVDQLQATLRPGDLLLVEGNSRISTAIKYLTQSTWSHVCLYIGEHEIEHPLLEADLVNGVNTVALNKYDGFNLRICRPVNLSEQDSQALIAFALSRLGDQYDTKNIIDLMRYLLPTPPIPQRFRRSLLEFGSGDPTKAICSTLVAQSFQSIRYPILPLSLEADGQAKYESKADFHQQGTGDFTQLRKLVFNRKQTLTRRHYSHFTPRDFDLSPYFEVVKPTLCDGFDYKAIRWAD